MQIMSEMKDVGDKLKDSRDNNDFVQLRGIFRPSFLIVVDDTNQNAETD